MAFRVGQTIGGYRFLRVLEAEGSSMVYEVQNEIAGRREILKLLPSGFEEDRNRVDRFLREAKIHSRLSHKNIAEFYSGIQLDGQLVMTMEAVEGDSLEKRITAGTLSIQEAIEVARQALTALDYAHDQQIVHREITPETIHITPTGVVKLIGLGLAKQEHDPSLTQIGAVVGAVHYMSPEQVKGQRDIDGRADIYALGIVLYESVTGKKPFDSQSQFDIIQAQVMQAPTPPSKVSPFVSEELSAVILKALEKDRNSRYQTAGAFRTALDALRKPKPQSTQDDAALHDMQKLAQSLEIERGPAPARQKLRVLQTGAAESEGRLKKPADLPAWTKAGPAALDPSKATQTRASTPAPVVSLWGMDGWSKRDLTVITVLAFVMSGAAVVALMVWLGL